MVLMPISLPVESTSAPPELPGLIAASVWSSPRRSGPSSACTVRSRPETMPWVTVGPPPRSSGKPIASTPSPSLACEEWPERDRDQVGQRHADDRQVALRRRADDRALDGRLVPPVVERDGHLPRAADDVVVREDHAAAVDHDARALALVAVEPDRPDVDDSGEHARDDVCRARAARCTRSRSKAQPRSSSASRSRPS